MAFEGERRNCRRLATLMVPVIITVCSCTIGRIYRGSEIRGDPGKQIVIGSTTKGEILGNFGPPDWVQKQFDGDIFIYAYMRKNSSTLTLEDPVFTSMTFFTFNRVQEKRDSLIILFDKDGVVKNYGYHKGTGELTPL